MTEETLTKAEFIARFTAHMLRCVHPLTHFDADEDGPGQSIAAYAEETAASYWDEDWQASQGPEACADCDLSYWEE